MTKPAVEIQPAAKVEWEPGGKGISIDCVKWETQRQCRKDLGLSERELARLKRTGTLPVHARAAFRKFIAAFKEAADAADRDKRREMRRAHCPVAQAGMNATFAVRAMAWKVREAIMAQELDPEAHAPEVEEARNATDTALRVAREAKRILALHNLNLVWINRAIQAVQDVEATLFRISCHLGMQGETQDAESDQLWPPGMEEHYLVTASLPQVIVAEAQAEHASSMAVNDLNFRRRREEHAREVLDEMITELLPEGEDEWTEAITKPAMKWTRRAVDHPADEL